MVSSLQEMPKMVLIVWSLSGVELLQFLSVSYALLTLLKITKLDIMAYLDPASNPRSKPQRLCATNCKSSTPDKLQTFRTIFGISCKYLTKNYLHEITLFVLFWRGISCKRNHETFQDNKEKNQWFEIKCPVLMAAWLNPTY